jgi:hypothetical protein
LFSRSGLYHFQFRVWCTFGCYYCRLNLWCRKIIR